MMSASAAGVATGTETSATGGVGRVGGATTRISCGAEATRGAHGFSINVGAGVSTRAGGSTGAGGNTSAGGSTGAGGLRYAGGSMSAGSAGGAGGAGGAGAADGAHSKGREAAGAAGVGIA